MKPIYLAPMEGVSGFVFRNTVNEIFGGIDKFYTPFIVPITKREFKDKELKDILPDNNKGMEVVPQILTNNSDDFIRTANNLIKYGYKEINLNLGCPSGTVSSKGRGSGFLARKEELDMFLNDVYEYYGDKETKISIKTRIGMNSVEEFYDILAIFNKYPIPELTIHPRLREDFYKNPVHMDVFEWGYNNTLNPACYNGDVRSTKDYNEIVSKYENITGVMIGRGIVGRPWLASDIKNGIEENNPINSGRVSKVKEFVLALMENYSIEMQENVNVLFKMKELWCYMGMDFEDQKLVKRIKKVKKLEEFVEIVKAIE